MHKIYMWALFYLHRGSTFVYGGGCFHLIGVFSARYGQENIYTDRGLVNPQFLGMGGQISNEGSLESGPLFLGVRFNNEAQ